MQQFLGAMQDRPEGALLIGLLPSLTAMSKQITDCKIIEYIGEIRKALNWIETGEAGESSAEIIREDVNSGSDGNRQNNPCEGIAEGI